MRVSRSNQRVVSSVHAILTHPRPQQWGDLRKAFTEHCQGLKPAARGDNPQSSVKQAQILVVITSVAKGNNRRATRWRCSTPVDRHVNGLYVYVARVSWMSTDHGEAQLKTRAIRRAINQICHFLDALGARNSARKITQRSQSEGGLCRQRNHWPPNLQQLIEWITAKNASQLW